MKKAIRETSLLVAAVFSLIPPRGAWANPTGFELQAGVVEVPTMVGNELIINQSSQSAIINWADFSIGLGETTTFNQPHGGATMNRVVGLSPSLINGALNANGSVWLINPNGTLVGSAGVIQTGSFLASTLDISNGEFTSYASGASNTANFSGSSSAGIQNLGQIRASAGDVMLFARHVENAGTINAPAGDAGLAAGQEITLVKAGAERIQVKPAGAGDVGGTGVSNTGTIEAVQAELKANGGNIYSMAVNNGGAVRATGVVNRGGKLFLSAGGGKVTNSGALTASAGDKGGDIQVTGKNVTIASGSNIDASGDNGGGNVLIGGDFQGQGTVPTAETTEVQSGASIRADARQNGDGGKVIVWADGGTLYRGNVSATGGAVSGNGGFVEVSGKGWLGFQGNVILLAANGSKGTLLLDPSTITIQAATPDLNGDTVTGDDIIANIAAGDFVGLNSVITSGALVTLLNAANVSLAATNAINVNSAVSWNSAFSLSLNGGTNVNVAASISNLGTGGLNLTATVASAITADITLTGGALLVTGPTSIGANITTGGAQSYTGLVTLTGAGATRTLTGTTPTFTAGMAGGGNNVVLNFSGTTALVGASFTGINNLSTGNGGSTTITGALTTTGTQTYGDAVTLVGATTLTGTTVTNSSTLVGGGNGLTVTGNAVVNGAITGVTNYSVSGTAGLGADVTTTGTQLYGGAVTLSGGNRVLTGTTVTNNSTLAGGGNGLTLTGNAVVNGAITAVTNLSVSGTTSVGADITTTGTQSYTGLVTLTGAAATRTLTGSTPTFTAGMAGGGNNAVLNFSGTTALVGASFTGINNLSTGNNGSTTITGTLTTGGTQTYNDTVNIVGNSTLSGAGITMNAATTLADGVTLTVGAGAATPVSLAAVTGTLGGAPSNLTINTTGAVTVSGAVGTDIGTVTVTNSGGTTFQSTVDAASVVLTNTTGTIAFQGNTTLTTGLTTLAQAYAVSFTGGTNTIAGDTNFLNTGTVTLGNDAGDTVTFTGGLDTTTGPTGTNVAGIVQTTNTQMDLGATTMLANTTLRSGSGAINLASITDGVSSFTLSLGSATQTGAVTTAGNATFNTLTTFANGYNIAFNGTTTTVDTDTNFLNTGTVTLGNDAGDTVTFTGGLDTTTGPTGTNVAGIVQTTNTQMDLGATTMLANTTLRSGSGAINLASITDGVSSFTLSLGSATQTGAVTTAGNATFNTLTTFANGYNIAFNGTTTTVDTDTNFLNTGTVTLGNDAGDTVTFTGGLDTTTGPTGTNVAGIVQTTNTQMDLGATTMLANTTLRSGSGAINLASITDGVSSFTLSLGSATQTGAVTTAGNATFNTLTTFANGYNIAFNGTTTTVDTDTNFLNTGTVTLGNDAGDTVTFTGGLDTTTGPTGTNVAGIVQTTNTQMDLGATTMLANTTLRSGSGAINLASITDGVSSFTLSLGSATQTGAVTTAGNATFNTLTTFANGYNIAFNGTTTTVDTDTNFLNTGTVTLGNDAGDTVTFTGGLDTTTGPTGTNVAGIVQTTNTQMDLGATTMLANTTLRSGSGAINLASITDGVSSFTLSLGSATQTGAVTTAGNATFNTLTTFANGYNIAFNGTTTTVDTDTNFLNTGTVTLGNDAGDTVTFTGGLATAGNATNPSGTNIGGIVRTAGQQIDLGALTLTGNSTVDSSNNGGSAAGAVINIASIAGGTFDLALQSRGGITTVAGAAANLGTLTLHDNNAGSTGSMIFNGNLTANTLTTVGRAYAVQLNGGTTTITTDTNFLNTGAVTLGDGGDTLTFTGGLATAGNATNPSGTNIGGTVQTTNGQIDLGTTTFTDDASVTAGASNLNIVMITTTPNRNLSLIAGLKLTLPAQAINTGTGALTLRSNGGTLATNGNITGGAVTLFGSTGLTIGHDVTANSLDLGTTLAAVNQTAGTLVVTTTTNVGAVGAQVGSISLTQATNDFQGTVSLQNTGNNNVSITDKDTLRFGTSVLGKGTLTINAVGITQTGAITQDLTTGLVTGLVTITGNGGPITLENAGNDFVGGVTATSTGAISLRDANSLQVAAAGINSGTTLTLNTGGGVTQVGPVTANTLEVTAGGDVLLNLLAGIGGVNQINNLGTVTVTGAGSDFVLFDGAGGLNLGAAPPTLIASSGGVKIVTDGGMKVNGAVTLTSGAPLTLTGDDTPPGYATVLVANHNSVPATVGGPDNFVVQPGGTFTITPGTPTVIYVDTQSASIFAPGNFVPLNFSPNTVFAGTLNNNLNLVNAGSTVSVLAIAGPLEVNDQAGQLNIDDLFKKLQEMADPARGAGLLTVDKTRRRQLSAQMAAFKQKRGAGIIDPFSFGPLQFLGYDFQDFMDAGYGTPTFDPSKLSPETPKSILDGLPLTNNR